MKNENIAPSTTAAVVINHATSRSAAVDSRIFAVANQNEIHVFASQQRTITYRALHNLGKPSTIAEIAAIATTLGLKSKTPVAASVRYHLHYLVNDGFVVIK